MKLEIQALTSIRGIAAVYVMLFHYFEHANTANLSNINIAVLDVIDKGYLSVDLFFFLSAFVMSLAYSTTFKNGICFNDYKTFLIKRFVRIYPLYFLFCFVYFFINNKSLPSLGLNLTLFQIFFDQPYYMVDVFWSLSAEWVLYFIFPFLFFVQNKFNSKWINGFLILASAIGIHLLKYMNYHVLTLDGIEDLGFTTLGMARGLVAVYRCILGYVIGISLFKFIEQTDVVTLRKTLKPWFVLPIFITLFFDNTQTIVFIGFVALIASCYVNNNLYKYINSGIIYQLGLWSYSIYIIHRAVKSLSQNIIGHLSDNLLATNIIYIILSIGFSYFTYKYIEKYFNKTFMIPSVHQQR